jgi:hypothetical protein
MNSHQQRQAAAAAFFAGLPQSTTPADAQLFLPPPFAPHFPPFWYHPFHHQQQPAHHQLAMGGFDWPPKPLSAVPPPLLAAAAAAIDVDRDSGNESSSLSPPADSPIPTGRPSRSNSFSVSNLLKTSPNPPHIDQQSLPVPHLAAPPPILQPIALRATNGQSHSFLHQAVQGTVHTYIGWQKYYIPNRSMSF